MRPKISAAKLPILPTGKWPLPTGKRFFCDQFSQGEIQCLGEISMDRSIRTKGLPMTVPEVSSSG